MTDRYRCRALPSSLEELGGQLHLMIGSVADVEHVWQWSEYDTPPEEPPHESSWFTGFKVVPIMLLTVSPSCTIISAECWGDHEDYEHSIVPVGFEGDWSKPFLGRVSRTKEESQFQDPATLQKRTAPSDSNSLMI